ncbi:unnamed protein product, partial [Iphiclides podalirius]
MKFAHDFLGSESVALKVADFVVKAFNTVKGPNSSSRKKQTRPTNEDYAEKDSQSEEGIYKDKPNALYQTSAMSPWRHLVRLLGLRPNQISAVAVNALVFVAQMISTFLSGKLQRGKPHRVENPTEWILNKKSRRLQEIIATAKNESLSELIEDIIKEQESQEETSCIRLLVCKITPFITKMQNTVFGGSDMRINNNSTDSFGAEILYRHLPTTKEIYNHSDVCEKRYNECDLNA